MQTFVFSFEQVYNTVCLVFGKLFEANNCGVTSLEPQFSFNIFIVLYFVHVNRYRAVCGFEQTYNTGILLNTSNYKENKLKF